MKQYESDEKGDKVMRKAITAAMFLILAATGCVSAQRGLETKASGSGARVEAVSLTPLSASDGTFSVEMPTGWQVRTAQVRSTFAQSARGESLAWGAINAIDVPHFQMYQQMLGQFAGYARQVFPVVANPMPPAEIVLQLYPRFFREAQDLRVLLEQRSGPFSSLIFYRYMIQYPAPRLMRGAARIEIVLPPSDNFGIWTIAYWKAEAPESLFDQDMPLFEKVFSSLHYDANRILRLAAADRSTRNRTIGNIIHQQGNEFARSSQAINQFGQFMQSSQISLGNAFSQANLEQGEQKIASLAEQEIKVDADGNRHQVGFDADCVNDLSHKYGYSKNQGCAALGPNWQTVNAPPLP
jgi:hypothetical protein